jgi:hypothetical protein
MAQYAAYLWRYTEILLEAAQTSTNTANSEPNAKQLTLDVINC